MEALRSSLNAPVFRSRIPQIPALSQNASPSPPKGLGLKTPTISLPEKPPKVSPTLPIMPLPASTSPSFSAFQEKFLFFETLGVDLVAAAAAHPPIAAVPLADVRAAAGLLISAGGLTAGDFRRAAGMCPEILAASPAAIAGVLAFLLREAGVAGRDLRRVINRRPRLLVSDVIGRLRPTLYFLQMLGVTDIPKHTNLLSCGVEQKFLPRLEFLQAVGFSSRESRAMVRRFPQLFCYSIEGNLRPKFEFLVSEMRRELRELKEFPQYFSFSLDERIRPRHRACKEKGVRLPLPGLLRPSDGEFSARLEVCVGSSPPLRSSPLWHETLSGDW